MQRVTLCVVVLACVATPFVPLPCQVACACLCIAAWAAFTTANYAHIVKKSAAGWTVPVFRQLPARLFMGSSGFACGWLLSFATMLAFGTHAEAFTPLQLAMAFVLVFVVMVFFPASANHGENPALPRTPAPVTVPGVTESELFDLKCTEAAKRYRLSPRETDILCYLAKGRNAAYIQGKLCISPHTVKSHIYSIYRKFDIHSQQKLMDFIEDYPLDADALEAVAKARADS